MYRTISIDCLREERGAGRWHEENRRWEEKVCSKMKYANVMMLNVFV